MDFRIAFWYFNYWLSVLLMTSFAWDGTTRDPDKASPRAQDQVTSLGDAEVDAEFIGQISNVTVAKGRDAVLSCSVSQSSHHTVGWLRVSGVAEGVRSNTILAMGENIVIHDNRFTVESWNDRGSPMWKLNIRNVRPEDAGWYMAQISNTDPIKSQMAHLTVLEPPYIDDSVTPSHYTKREGDYVELNCTATGIPIPKITWKREDGTAIVNDSCRPLNKTSSLPPGDGYGRLCISSVTRNASGTYFCIASNGIAPITSKRIQLSVEFPPYVQTNRPLVGALIGGSASIDCIAQSSPPVRIYWYKETHPIATTNQRYASLDTKLNPYTIQSVLVIGNFSSDDAGVYRCQAGDRAALIRIYILQTTTGPSSTFAPFTVAKRIRTDKTLPAIVTQSHWTPRSTLRHNFHASSMTTTFPTTARVSSHDLVYKNYISTSERARSESGLIVRICDKRAFNFAFLVVVLILS